MKELTAEAVETITLDCLFKDGEDQAEAVKVEGIKSTYGFHPERLKKHESEIGELLAQLPDGFHRKTGGGWTFLNACETKDGKLWTGLHLIVEQLMCLGIATKKVEYLMPRDMWDVLPGRMPYFVIND